METETRKPSTPVPTGWTYLTEAEHEKLLSGWLFAQAAQQAGIAQWSRYPVLLAILDELTKEYNEETR